MNRLRTPLILVLILFPGILWAHPEPGFTIVNAEDESKVQIERLVDEEVLPETWRTAYSDLDRSGMVLMKGKHRWVMVYVNAEAEDNGMLILVEIQQ